MDLEEARKEWAGAFAVTAPDDIGLYFGIVDITDMSIWLHIGNDNKGFVNLQMSLESFQDTALIAKKIYISEAVKKLEVSE